MYVTVGVSEKKRPMLPDQGLLLKTLTKATGLQGQCLVTARILSESGVLCALESWALLCVLVLPVTASMWDPFLWMTWIRRRVCTLCSSSCGHCR